MAILPVQLARVSNTLRTSIAQRSLTQTQQSLVEVQNELATGKRLNVPSDDPAAASVAQQLRKLLEQRSAYSNNLKSSSSQLGQVDSTLNDLTDLLRQAQTIASANVGSVVSADERSAAATVVTSLYNQALSLANQQSNGMYLFGGDRGKQQPFTSDLGGIRFTGSVNVLQNSVDPGTALPLQVDGNSVFGALSTRIQGTADLGPALTAATRLADLGGAGGDGVRLGSILLGNGATSSLIDLSKADSVSDVMDAINAAGVGGITASLSADHRGITLAGAADDNISVKDVGGTTAADLGIAASAAGADTPVIGQDLNARLTSLTRLADLKLGAGIDLADGLTITNGTKIVTVKFGAAASVEDMLNAINGAGIGVLAQINDAGTGIDVHNSVQGLSMTIAENGGTTAADLGIRSFSPATPLAELNFGHGLRTVDGPDMTVTRTDGTSFSVDLSNLNTVQQVIDAINTADGGAGVTASFSANGNGLVLTDSTTGTGTLSVTPVNYSHAVEDLGLNVLASGNKIVGRDVNAVADSSLFGNLAKLRDALLHNDQNGITDASGGIQKDLDRVVRTRGQVGAQVQELDSRTTQLDDQNTATQSLLSSLEDTDYNEAITRFQTLQTALQANLQTTGRVLNMSLLDFLQ